MRIFVRPLITIITLSILAGSAAARRHQKAAETTAPAPQSEAPKLSVPPPNDTALFLAGMPVPKNSVLFPLTQNPAWTAHASNFEKAFGKLNTRKLSKLRAWQNSYLPESKAPIPVAYYMFSGPDFLYFDQFFPNATVYIMCGKESLGPPPDPMRISDLGSALHNLENAMKSSLATTYFITQDMKLDFGSQSFRGVVPILYVFLARGDKSITDVTYGSLGDGGFHVSAPGSGGTPGVRINFRDNHSHREQTLFYFTTDISDGGISSNGAFMSFCAQHGVGASFLKSSSYLMFENGFNRVREFILNHSNLIVQDDSGIPIRYFNRDKWNLRFFGSYVGPINLFKQHYQSELADLYQKSAPPPFGIGLGYQWDYRKSNLIVAQRQ
jgi:hypothetical protein